MCIRARPDTGRVILEVRDGKVRIRTGAACIGQGMATMATQVLCETTGLTADKVFVERPDTVRTPDSVSYTHLLLHEAYRCQVQHRLTSVKSWKDFGST